MKSLFTLRKTLSAIMAAGFVILVVPVIARAQQPDQMQQQIQSLQQQGGGGGGGGYTQQIQSNALAQYNAIEGGSAPVGGANTRTQQMESNALARYNAIQAEESPQSAVPAAPTAAPANQQSAMLNAMQQATLGGGTPAQTSPNQPTLQNGANPATADQAVDQASATPGALPASPFGASNTRVPVVPPPPPFVLPSQAQTIPAAPSAALAAAAAATPPAATVAAAPAAGGQPAQPAVPNVSQSDLDEAAFSSTMQNTLPMTSDQIQRLRSLYMASQFAASSSPITPPRPTATSQFVDLAPGATPPVIRLSQGFITSLVFIDSTGAPWPIQAYDVGNPTAFNIQWDKTSNTLMIQSITMYNYGNLAVRLRGLQTPVMLTLIPGQRAVDYRVDLRVQGYGPNASQLPTTNGLPPSADPALLGVLDGVPPDGSTLLTVVGGECQAWLLGNSLYVRTRLDLLSPGWLGTMSSADGMHAYVMQPSPILLVSLNGKVVQLKIEGF